MRPNTKVTIGLCVKNDEASIKQAIDSIIRQGFPHKLMELIVVDGNSEDRTLLIIEKSLTQVNIKFRIFQENKGLGFARQIVVDNSSGDYIVWVDGDMILPRDHVRKQVEFMEQNPKVGIARGKHGIYPGANLFVALEDIAYVAVDSKYGEKATSWLPGTGGSIYRVEAIRQVGGFDYHIRGVGEDIEAAYRIKEAGWLVRVGTPALFYERRKQTWKKLWDHYFWYGYGGYYILRKNSGIFDFYKMVPPVGFLAGVWYSLIAYKLTRRKRVFLLPLHYTFKRIAWCFGFAKGQIHGTDTHNDRHSVEHSEKRLNARTIGLKHLSREKRGRSNA